MNKNVWLFGALAYSAVLSASASMALAQDGTDEQQKPGGQKKSDRDAAIETMPAWESYGSGDAETLEETFFRLARDFVSTSEIGVRRLGSVPVWPRGDLKVGPFRIFPWLREAVEYESNLFLQPETGRGSNRHGREPTWTHVNEVGLLADTALAGGRAHITGSAQSIWNVRYQDDRPDTWEFDGQLGATYRWPIGAWVTGGIAWERRDDAADYPDVGSAFQRTNRRGFLNWGFDRDIFFGTKAQFEMGVSTRNVQAADKPFDNVDRQETTYFAKVSYPFLKKTTRIFAMATYRNDMRESDSINDGQVGGFNVGMEGSIPLSEGDVRGIRGQISVGFQSALYDNGSYTRGSKRFVSDPNRRNTNLDIMAALQYVASSRTSVDLRFIQTNQFSLHGNYQLVDRVDLTLNHNFSRRLTTRLAMYAERASPSGTLNPDTVDGPTLQSRDANPVNTTGIGVGARYAFNDWMDFDASFDVMNRNAELEKSSKDYRGILGVTIYLNALTPRARTAPER